MDGCFFLCTLVKSLRSSIEHGVLSQWIGLDNRCNIGALVLDRQKRHYSQGQGFTATLHRVVQEMISCTKLYLYFLDAGQ